MRADVVIPVYADVELTRTCIESVLEHSGTALARLVLIDDCGPDGDMRPMLRSYRERDARVHVLENPRNLGFVGTANRGLSICEGHAVVLNSDTRVTPGWLEAMLEVLTHSDRIAAVCPLSNNGTLCSVPSFGDSTPEASVAQVPGTLGGLPAWTELPTGNGFCMLMRDTARAALGLFDPAFGRGYNEENDWCQRARAQGMVIARANRAFVFHRGEVSFGAARPVLDLMNATRLVARYPRYLAENGAFAESPPAHLAASGARSVLSQERWSLHPGLSALPGVVSGLQTLSAKRGASLLPWTDRPPPGAEDLRFAPLHHEAPSAALAALKGTGRLVTVMDAWRPAPVGRLQALRWAQLQASDVVLVPSSPAAKWLAEEGSVENVRVVPWLTGGSSGPTPAPTGPRHGLLLVAPSPAIRVMVEMALARLDVTLELVVLPADVSPKRFEAALQKAVAVADFGGTSAGLLARSVEISVPLLSALTSVAGEPSLPSTMLTPSIEGVATALTGLLDRAPAQDAVAFDPAAEWDKALDAVLLKPRAGRAEARAALQALITS